MHAMRRNAVVPVQKDDKNPLEYHVLYRANSRLLEL